MTARCEPPEGWRERDGWHWVQWPEGPPQLLRWRYVPKMEAHGWTLSTHSTTVDGATDAGWRYLAPVTPPAVVAGLVEALEGLLVGCEYRPGGYSFAFGDDVPAGWGTKTIPTDAALDAARSALAAAKEAGP